MQETVSDDSWSVCARFGLVILAGAVCLAQQPLPAARELHLSLKQALDIALSPEGNTAIQIAGLESKIASERSKEALSALLPNLDGTAYISNYTRSLSAQALTEVQLPFGLVLAPRVGPVSAFDFRSQLTGNIFNLSAVRRYQASRAVVQASKLEVDGTKENIAAQVARQYLAALRAAAQIEAEEANVNLAQALEGQAKRLRDAGNGIESDIDRADLQISDAQLALQGARSDLKQAKLALLRAMRQDLNTELDLTDRLAYVMVDPVTLSSAKLEAEKARPDLRAQKEREQAARLGVNASRAERLPSLVGFADYGTTGNTNVGSLPTFTLGVSLRLPVYDGGRRRAQAAESSALAREASLRRQDLDDQIDYDLRTALERLDTAEQQVKTATEGLSFAQKTLAGANRRYAEGIAGSIEVTDAQTRLARAQNSRIAALFSHNLARIDLSRAMGSLVEMLEK